MDWKVFSNAFPIPRNSVLIVHIWKNCIVVALALGLVLTACSKTAETTGTPQSSVSATNNAAVGDSTSADKFTGDKSDPVNKIALSAVDDLQKYWTAEFPKLYGTAYTPVEGGFYGVVPSSGNLPPCASSPDDIAGNAFYCADDDVVAWDAEGLLPDLQKKFGDFVIPIVLAHEWGHAIQARAKFEGKTVTREIQADCFAGAWSAHTTTDDTPFKPTSADMDNALAGFLSLRDEPGSDKDNPSAHGSGFDRVSSFQTGFDGGPDACKPYADGTPVVTELPFNNAADQSNNGDAPLDQIIAGVPKDLEDYWSKLYPEIADEPWKPLNPVVPFDPAEPPDCGGSSVADYSLFYCIPDDYVGFDAVDAMPTFYEQGGDFAVATLIATQYGLAADTRLGGDATDKTASLRGDCFAGSWTASVLLQNRPESGYQLSPGDLDEAVAALLLFRGSGDEDRQGSGFTRVEAYRHGVIDGAQACIG